MPRERTYYRLIRRGYQPGNDIARVASALDNLKTTIEILEDLAKQDNPDVIDCMNIAFNLAEILESDDRRNAAIHTMLKYEIPLGVRAHRNEDDEKGTVRLFMTRDRLEQKMRENFIVEVVYEDGKREIDRKSVV